MKKSERKLRKQRARKERLRREAHRRRFPKIPDMPGFVEEPGAWEDEGDEDVDEEAELNAAELSADTEAIAARGRAATERALREIHSVMAAQDFKTVEEANQFLGGITGKPVEDLRRLSPERTPQQQAQDLAFDAMEAMEYGQAEELARQALELDPDCVDARLILANLTAESSEEHLDLLREVVLAGQRVLGESFIEQNRGRFWGIIETRPYMRALEALAFALLDDGQVAEAIAAFRRMIDLNPSDNQGARDLLLPLYLGGKRLKEARALLRLYPDDASAVFIWSEILERFLADDLRSASAALADARKEDPQLLAYFTRLSPGSDEVDDSAVLLRVAWEVHPEAKAWLLAAAVGLRPVKS